MLIQTPCGRVSAIVFILVPESSRTVVPIGLPRFEFCAPHDRKVVARAQIASAAPSSRQKQTHTEPIASNSASENAPAVPTTRLHERLPFHAVAMTLTGATAQPGRNRSRLRRKPLSFHVLDSKRNCATSRTTYIRIQT